jgi:hypothetical protein
MYVSKYSTAFLTKMWPIATLMRLLHQRHKSDQAPYNYLWGLGGPERGGEVMWVTVNNIMKHVYVELNYSRFLILY